MLFSIEEFVGKGRDDARSAFRYIHMPVVVRIREMGCGHTANPRGSFRNTIHKKNGRKFPDQMSVKDFQAQLFPRHFLFRQQTKDLHVGPSNLTCSLWKRRIHLFFNFWLRFHLYYLAKSGHRGLLPSTGSLREKKNQFLVSAPKFHRKCIRLLFTFSGYHFGHGI